MAILIKKEKKGLFNMKLLSKVIAMILSVAIASASTCTVLAEEDIKPVADNNLKILQAFDIVSSDFDTDKLGNIVTKGEFINYIIKSFNFDVENDLENVFWDVKKGSEYEKSINTAYGMGLISGNDDGSFTPFMPIKYTDAVVIVARALGYVTLAELRGGYPAGYLSVASSLKLPTAGTAEKGEMSYSDMFLLIKEMLTVNVLKVTGRNQITTNYSDTDNKTFLEVYHNGFEDKGIVEANYLASLKGYPTSMGTVRIDGQIYSAGNTNALELLGYAVQFYYKQNSKNDEYTLVYISILDKKNDVIEIAKDDILGFSDGKISYTEKNINKSVELPVSVSVIYNNKNINYYLDYNEELFDIDMGNIKLIDNNNDGLYDVVIIDDYFNIIANVIDLNSRSIYDKYDRSKAVFLNESSSEPAYSIFDADGKKLQLSDIKKGSILTVYQSIDKKYCKIIVSNKTISGIISEVTKASDDSIESVVVDGVTYDVSSNAQSNEKIEFKIGENATFCLDFKDRIANVIYEDLSKIHLGYLLGAEKKPLGEPRIQVLDKESNIKIYTLKKNVTVDGLEDFKDIDGKTHKFSDDGILYYFNETKAKAVDKQVIKYELNDDGKIISIDTATKTAAEDEKSLCLRNNGVIRITNDTIGGKYIFDDKAVLFDIPIDKSDIDKYEAVSVSILPTGKDSTLKLYSVGSDTCFISAAVREDTVVDTTPPSSAYSCAIKNIYSTINEDGETVKAIKVLSGTTELDVLVPEEFEYLIAEAEKGDLIRYATNNRGELNRFMLVYDYSAKQGLFRIYKKVLNDQTNQMEIKPEEVKVPYQEFSWNTARIYLGIVYDTEKGCIRIGIDMNNVDDTTLETYNALKVKSYAYGVNERGDVYSYAITKDNIIDYKSSGNKALTAVVQTYCGDIRALCFADHSLDK